MKRSLWTFTVIILLSCTVAPLISLPLHGELQENQVCILERQDPAGLPGGTAVEAMSVWPRTSSDFFQSRKHGDPLLRIRNGSLELFVQNHTWSAWIPADQVAVEGISNGIVYIGQILSLAQSGKETASMQPSHYIQTESRIVMIDLESGKIIESRLPDEPNDYITLRISNLVGYVEVHHAYNRFSTGPVDYEGIYLIPRNDFALHGEVFHYYSHIGAQGMPYAKLINMDSHDGKLYLDYSYYESIGIPDFGMGTFSLWYSTGEKNFSLGEIDFDVHIKQDIYGSQWPFRGPLLISEPELYAGEGWYPNEGGFANTVHGMNSRFAYFGKIPPFLWGIDTAWAQKAEVTVDHLRVRSAPTLEGEILGKVFTGMEVEVLDRSGCRQEIDGMNSYWYRISHRSVKEGWCFGGYLEIE